MRYAGIDLGVHKIAMAFLDDDQMVSAYAWEAPSELTRPLQLRELGGLAHDMCELNEVEYVWIEDVIIGNNRKYSIGLAQTLGAVMAMLAQLRMGQGTDIRTVDNKVWKKGLIGHGNATKVEARDYINVTYPAYSPFCGDDQDLYDASCIALYGRDVVERAVDLQL